MAARKNVSSIAHHCRLRAGSGQQIQQHGQGHLLSVSIADAHMKSASTVADRKADIPTHQPRNAIAVAME
jgi:hypothetical protein